MNISYKQENILWQAGHLAVDAAVKHARRLGLHIAVAVVDRGGNLVAFLRSEEGPYLSINIAIDKAYTAASFAIPTSGWGELLPKDSLLRESIINQERFIAFGGGLPINVNGACIGAIGVSGASEQQDEACAQIGLDAVIKKNHEGRQI